MNQLNLFIELTRLKKPIGYMLLFWPCAWGLTLVYNFNDGLQIYFYYLLLFFLGSVLMRSAGCIVNDILDRKYDKEVSRTKDRPIASGKISVKVGVFYALILCSLAFLVLINFNNLTIFLALASMPLAFTYPLMKRFTYWPQLFLGITFNYGLLLGWTSISEKLDIIPLIFYIGAIFWTLGYDTIYGFQDIKDDEIIGVKSTSIKFKGSAKIFLILCYSLLTASLLIGGFVMSFNQLYFLFIIIPITHLFFYQIKNFDTQNPSSCLKVFKSNNYLGIIVFCNILIGKFI
ncbi:4-hydroxybenzoate octaprenyltransferase [Candidatus Pelagibacter sp.]|uniref:4-hydroxybenzoate octaprenyltransferase n=1 Tax=Candidatus Pelagibacter sp. TaxID=2024849 RepID=UPI003F8791BD